MKPMRFTELQIKQIVLVILSNPVTQGFVAPFTIELTDASGDTASYSVSGDYEITSQDLEKFFVGGCCVVLTDSTGKAFGSKCKPMPLRMQ
ncbi:MAG TPA: hypothetical protein VGR55_00910 [Candidatus Acidoferrum sp.]|nr:hypothetical protein [Candidatus Acidoferrum sp.]